MSYDLGEAEDAGWGVGVVKQDKEKYRDEQGRPLFGDPLQTYFSGLLYKWGYRSTKAQIAAELTADIKANPHDLAHALIDSKVFESVVSYRPPHVHDYRWNLASTGWLVCVAGADEFGNLVEYCNERNIDSGRQVPSMKFVDMPKYEGEIK